jgi:hypothetical protein
MDTRAAAKFEVGFFAERDALEIASDFMDSLSNCNLN